MNTWKLLNKSKGSSVNGRATSRSHRQKYDPKRQDNQSNTSNRFHNKSILKNQSSIFDQQSVKSNEKRGSNLEGERALKGCASELKLRNSDLPPVKVKVFNSNDKKQNLHDSISESSHDFLGDIRSRSRKHTKNSRNLDYQEEIKRIQADYKAFKAIILAELKKQEIMLHKMVRNLFEEFKESLEFKNKMENVGQKIKETIQSDKNMMRGLKLKLDKEENRDKTYKSPELIKFYSPTHKTENFTNFNESSSRTHRKAHRQMNIERHSFDKFMNAMKNLKEGMAEISQISDISSIKSPRASFERKVDIMR